MLDRTLKSLIAVLVLAGALGAPAGARVTSRVSSVSTPRALVAPHRRPRQEEGCVELPAPAPAAPPPAASCS